MTLEEIVEIMNELSLSYMKEYNDLVLSNSLTLTEKYLALGKQLAMLDLSQKFAEYVANKSISNEG